MTIIEISKNTFVIPNMKLKYKPTGNKKYFAFEPWSIMNGECMAFKYSHLCFHQFGDLMRYDYRLGVMKVHKDIMLNKDECFFNINQEIKLRLIIRDDNEPNDNDYDNFNFTEYLNNQSIEGVYMFDEPF